MIKAIIFDFGRVITVQKPLSLFRSYEIELGLNPDTINSIMFDSQAWQDALLGRKTTEEFWHLIGPELGLNTADEVNRFLRRYHADEAINEAVLDLIRKLCGRYKLAILSNAPPDLTRWLADWEMRDLFEVVFCSGDEGMIKPDPAAFKLTLERLGVEPGEAVFIDDTPENVEAARKLGIQGIIFTTVAALKDDLTKFLGFDVNRGC
ncbi:MAG: HAD family phosphatase [Desulfobulbaceae bacterium]|nr:HAD family phosphatase [Desulfobulbaceae bacterium]